MRLHANARTTPKTRKLLAERVLKEGWRVSDVAGAMGVSRSTAYKWIWRFEAEGTSGVQDRSSVPRRIWNRTAPRLVRRIEQLRRRRLAGWRIAEKLHMAISTVSGILRRLGLGRLKSLEPKEAVVRYERERPGELLHLDVKKLGRFRRPGHRVTGDRQAGESRGAGWEYVHVCVDDRSRVAYAEILGDERKASCVGFLRRCVAWFAGLGIQVQGALTDNGNGYVSHAFAQACTELGVAHLRTRPYRPQTNGKAERFIQTLLREWAYARRYQSARARAKALGPWLEHYNRRRPHWSLGRRPPFERLKEAV